MAEDEQKLVEENLKLVPYIVKRYCKFVTDDLLQEGYVGLVKAAKTYNKDSGIKFATYASKCICNEIFVSMRTRKYDPYGKCSLVSLSTKIGDKKDMFLYEVIASDEDLEDEFVAKDFNKYILERFTNSSINSKCKEAIIRFYLHNEKQEDIAKDLGVVQPTIARRIKKGLNAFRKEFENGT